MCNKNNYPRTTLSLLWTTTMFFMVFADIFSIIVELEVGNSIQIPIDARTAMSIGALMTAIPILMIVLSWLLPYKINRLANIIVGIFTGVYIIAGGSITPHYLIMASFEILLIISITIISLKWKQ